MVVLFSRLRLNYFFNISGVCVLWYYPLFSTDSIILPTIRHYNTQYRHFGYDYYKLFTVVWISDTLQGVITT